MSDTPPCSSPPLDVLVVGSGGREHALARACARSPLARRVVAAPGNPGIAELADCVPVAADDVAGLVDLAVEREIGFAAVGPEVPLSLGLVDALAEKGVPAFGPSRRGAALEASKVLAKQLLLKYRIPTGMADSFDRADAALEYLETAAFPVVVKADGLAAGKGVVVASDYEEASAAVRLMMEEKAFGESGATVLVEECLRGEETSIHAIVSGTDYLILPTSQDHKAAFEGDLGPNTGGMGAYSPADLIDDALMARIERAIVKPSVEAIAAEGIDFRGALFIGLMLCKDGPKVLEYNVRFGDPEAQVILPRLETDPLELMLAAAQGRLGDIELRTAADYALCVVLAAKGYPGAYPKGEPIELPASLGSDEMLFHAGVARDEAGRLVTSGGRVLGATALAPCLEEAARKAYALADRVQFPSKRCRRDIGAKQLRRKA